MERQAPDGEPFALGLLIGERIARKIETEVHDLNPSEARRAARVTRQLFDFAHRVTKNSRREIFDAIAGEIYPGSSEPVRLLRRHLANANTPDKLIARRARTYSRICEELAAYLPSTGELGALGRYRFHEQVFRDTRLIREIGHGLGSSDENIRDLVHAVVDISRREVDFDLQCAMVCRAEGRYFRDAPAISAMPSNPLVVWPKLAWSYTVPEEHPPIPSIILYRVPLGEWRGTLKHRRSAVSLKSSVAPSSEQILKLLSAARDRGASITDRVISVQAWREVRLSIGPCDDDCVAKPMFEIRTTWELCYRGSRIQTYGMEFWDGAGSNSVVVREGETLLAAWIKMQASPVESLTKFLCDEPGGVLSWLDEPLLEFPSYYSVWLPVNAATCFTLRPRREADVRLTLLPASDDCPCPYRLAKDTAEAVSALIAEGRRMGRIIEAYAREVHHG